MALSAGYHATRFAQALRHNDLPAAQHQINSLRTDVRTARWSLTPLRPLGKIPVLGRPAADTTHAVDAAWFGVNAAVQGTEALRIANSGSLIVDGRVDLERLENLPALTTPLSANLVDSRAALVQVRGGWLPGMTSLRDAGLSQLDRAVPLSRAADEAARALPSALGAESPRTYIVATLNSGELLPSGGALLAVAQLRVENGTIDVVSRGQVSELTDLNQPVAWTPLPDDPWQSGSTKQALANANYSPDFPTSGEEILRLYQAQFGAQASGVITLDAAAFKTLLSITGPVQNPVYGEVTSANVVQKTLVDAYQELSGQNATRHAANNNLIDAMSTALLQVHPTKDDALTIGDAVRSGHIQMYFRDSGLQSALTRAGLSRTLEPFTDDVLGIYTMNTNASKVDVFQKRSVTQEVVLAADGSAEVTRTLVLSNKPERSCPTKRGTPDWGYLTCVSQANVVFSLPQTASGMTVGVNDKAPSSVTASSVEKDRSYFTTRIFLEPGDSATVVLRYRLPANPQRQGYTLHWDGQPMINTPELTVRVTPPPDTDLSGSGWQRDGDSLVASVPMSGSGELRLGPEGEDLP